MNRAAFLLAACAGAAAALEIDYAAAASPRTIQVLDRQLAARWQALFEGRPEWVPRQVAYVARRGGAQVGTLFAGRLLYPVEAGPWRRRESDPVDRRRWTATDREVRIAILREIRADGDPAWAALLGHVLAAPQEPTIVEQCLLTLAVLDPAAAAAAARRWSVPGRDDIGREPEARMRALRILVGIEGTDAAATRPLLGWALAEGTPGERTAALRLLPARGAEPLVETALPRLRSELAGEPGPETVQAAVEACARLGSPGPAGQAALADWCLHREREILCAAAAALGAALPGAATAVPGPRIAERLAGGVGDPAARAALATLLLRARPDLLAAVPGDDLQPWRSLAAHRATLARWEVDRLAGGR
jgi:hypothetical protein